MANAKKPYNPNTFNAVDSALAFITVLVAVIVVSLISSIALLVLKALGTGFLLCFSVIISQVTILAVAFVFCKIKKVGLFSGGGFDFRFDLLGVLPAVLLVAGTLILFLPVHTQFSDLLSEVQTSITGGSTLDSLDIDLNALDLPYLLLYVFILTPVLPAVCEECLFRGVIMRGLREFGCVTACLVSALVFALMHGNYAQLLLQFIVGLEIAIIDVLTGNIFIGCVMHALYNLLVVGYSVITASAQAVGGITGNLVQAFFIVLGLACFCLAVAYYINYARYKNGSQKNKKKPIFYTEYLQPPVCLLKQKSGDNQTVFWVNRSPEQNILDEKSGNLLFFDNGKFYPFNKKGKKVLSYVLWGIGLVLAITLIAIDFFIV